MVSPLYTNGMSCNKAWAYATIESLNPPTSKGDVFLTHNTLPTEECPLFHGPRRGHVLPYET